MRGKYDFRELLVFEKHTWLNTVQHNGIQNPQRNISAPAAMLLRPHFIKTYVD